MPIKLQGYKARDDASPPAFRSLGRQKLRASDIMSLILVATKLADVRSCLLVGNATDPVRARHIEEGADVEGQARR